MFTRLWIEILLFTLFIGWIGYILWTDIIDKCFIRYFLHTYRRARVPDHASLDHHTEEALHAYDSLLEE